MPSVILPTKADAQSLCVRLDALLAIPPEGLPGIGGPGRTGRWADPQELADGTWAVPVPRKGLLAELLDRLDAAPVAWTRVLTEDAAGLGPAVPKRLLPAEFADVRAKLAAARAIAPERTAELAAKG